MPFTYFYGILKKTILFLPLNIPVFIPFLSLRLPNPSPKEGFFLSIREKFKEFIVFGLAYYSNLFLQSFHSKNKRENKDHNNTIQEINRQIIANDLFHPVE
jgi:hypothetical protein